MLRRRRNHVGLLQVARLILLILRVLLVLHLWLKSMSLVYRKLLLLLRCMILARRGVHGRIGVLDLLVLRLRVLLPVLRVAILAEIVLI